jgi:hypothetical protein
MPFRDVGKSPDAVALQLEEVIGVIEPLADQGKLGCVHARQGHIDMMHFAINLDKRSALETLASVTNSGQPKQRLRAPHSTNTGIFSRKYMQTNGFEVWTGNCFII